MHGERNIMAVPWLVLLQAVPWDKVISNTPKVVDGAYKLLARLKGKTEKNDHLPQKQVAENIHLLDETEVRALIQHNQQEINNLQHDLQEVADLLQSLTGQNVRMISEIQRLRLRSLRMQRILILLVFVFVMIIIAYFIQ